MDGCEEWPDGLMVLGLRSLLKEGSDVVTKDGRGVVKKEGREVVTKAGCEVVTRSGRCVLKGGEGVVVNARGSDDGNCGEEDTGNWAGLEEMNGGRGEGSEGEEVDKEEEGDTAGLMAVKMLGVTEAKGELVILGVNKMGRGDENEGGLGELTAGTLEGVSLSGLKGVVTNARGEMKVPGREVKVPRVPGVVKVTGGRWVVITGCPRKPGVAVDTWGRGSGVGRGVRKLKGGGVGVTRGLS